MPQHCYRNHHFNVEIYGKEFESNLKTATQRSVLRSPKHHLEHIEMDCGGWHNCDAWYNRYLFARELFFGAWSFCCKLGIGINPSLLASLKVEMSTFKITYTVLRESLKYAWNFDDSLSPQPPLIRLTEFLLNLLLHWRGSGLDQFY